MVVGRGESGLTFNLTPLDQGQAPVAPMAGGGKCSSGGTQPCVWGCVFFLHMREIGSSILGSVKPMTYQIETL